MCIRDSHCTVNDTLTLGHYIAANYAVTDVLKKGTKMNTVEIKKGQTGKVDVITEKKVEAVLPKNYNPADLQYKFHLKNLTAPVKKNQNAGTMDVLYKKTKLWYDSERKVFMPEDIKNYFRDDVYDIKGQKELW